MEKDSQQPPPDMFATTAVKVKDFVPQAADHSEIYVTDPPPAYKTPKSSLVQIVRIVAMTLVAITITVGLFNLASIYIQANAVHRLQQLQNRHEQKINQFPKAESLVQQHRQQQLEDLEQEKKYESYESKNHVRRDYNNKMETSGDENGSDRHLQTNQLDSGNDSGEDETDAVSNNSSDEEAGDDDSNENDDENGKNESENGLKFPLQFDFDDLPEALFGLNNLNMNSNNNNNKNNNNMNGNKKSRMNCIVEKKVSEKMVNHEPKNIQLPFGLNLTTDKGFEHLTGEKIIILCESGNEQQPQQVQQPQQQEQPPPQQQQVQSEQFPHSQYFRQNVHQVPFAQNEPFPFIQHLEQFQQPRQQPQIMIESVRPAVRFEEREQPQQRHILPFVPLQKPSNIMHFEQRRPILSLRMPQPEQTQQPQRMIFITKEKIPLSPPRRFQQQAEATAAVAQPMQENPILPPIIKNIAEEIIRDHIESMRRERFEQESQKSQQQQEQQQQQQHEQEQEQQKEPKADQEMGIPEEILANLNRLTSPGMFMSLINGNEREQQQSERDEEMAENQEEEKSQQQSNKAEDHEIEIESEFEPEEESAPETKTAAAAPALSVVDSKKSQEGDNLMVTVTTTANMNVEQPQEQSRSSDEMSEMPMQREEAVQAAVVPTVTDPLTVTTVSSDSAVEPMSASVASSAAAAPTTANVVRDGRNLNPVQIPVKMVPPQEPIVAMPERPHYVHPRSV